VGVSTSGRGRWQGKGVGRLIWCKYCVHMYVNEKLYLLKLFQEYRRGDKGEWWRG
jgi:hypothetical protein